MKRSYKFFLLLSLAMTVWIVGFSVNAFATINIRVSTPGEFTSPSAGDAFSAGEYILISWGSSTADTEWGLEYCLSYYDGVQWIPVAVTDDTSITYLLPDTSLDQTQFRVFAQTKADEVGWGKSEFRYSGIFSITVVNTPPGTPGAFISPAGGETHEQGAIIEVEWGPASDADGDTISYELGFFNGNAWSVIRDLSDPNKAKIKHDALLPAAASAAAQYRVRAFDGADYSDYIYSNAFTVFQPIPTPTLTPAPITVPTATRAPTAAPERTHEPTATPEASAALSPEPAATPTPEPKAASPQYPALHPTAVPDAAPILLPESEATQILPPDVPQSRSTIKSILSIAGVNIKCFYIFMSAAMLLLMLIIILVVRRRKKRHRH